MITIYIHPENKGFIVDGHAEHDEYGKDIICASASTIVQLAIMGLTTLANQYPDNIKIIKEKYESK